MTENFSEYNELLKVGNNEINNRRALVQEYIDNCGYTQKEAIEAVDNTIEEDYQYLNQNTVS